MIPDEEGIEAEGLGVARVIGDLVEAGPSRAEVSMTLTDRAVMASPAE